LESVGDFTESNTDVNANMNDDTNDDPEEMRDWAEESVGRVHLKRRVVGIRRSYETKSVIRGDLEELG